MYVENDLPITGVDSRCNKISTINNVQHPPTTKIVHNSTALPSMSSNDCIVSLVCL